MMRMSAQMEASPETEEQPLNARFDTPTQQRKELTPLLPPSQIQEQTLKAGFNTPTQQEKELTPMCPPPQIQDRTLETGFVTSTQQGKELTPMRPPPQIQERSLTTGLVTPTQKRKIVRVNEHTCTERCQRLTDDPLYTPKSPRDTLAIGLQPNQYNMSAAYYKKITEPKTPNQSRLAKSLLPVFFDKEELEISDVTGSPHVKKRELLSEISSLFSETTGPLLRY